MCFRCKLFFKLVQVDNVQNEDKMHNDEIRKSLKKKEIDIRHITYLMKTTAFSRRQQILTSSLKIIEVQDLYPALKFQEWVSMLILFCVNMH